MMTSKLYSVNGWSLAILASWSCRFHMSCSSRALCISWITYVNLLIIWQLSVASMTRSMALLPSYLVRWTICGAGSPRLESMSYIFRIPWTTPNCWCMDQLYGIKLSQGAPLRSLYRYENDKNRIKHKDTEIYVKNPKMGKNHVGRGFVPYSRKIHQITNGFLIAIFSCPFGSLMHLGFIGKGWTFGQCRWGICWKRRVRLGLLKLNS